MKPVAGENQKREGRCYYHNQVRSQIIGRMLGTSLRVVGKIASEQLASYSSASTAAPSAPQPSGRVTSAPAATRVIRGTAKGLSGFFTPLRRAGKILWLQVTGSFFLLFAVFFLQNLWRLHLQWNPGKPSAPFLGSIAAALLFLYLGISSFWRARKH
jgi:hypothetical protein